MNNQSLRSKLTGLVAATHTPFSSDGRLNLAVIEKQAEHLLRNGVNSVFVGGSTGESHSLTLEERLALVKRWSEVVRSTDQRLIVHVGTNCLADARTMATHAQDVGAAAISALAPSYFKPKSLDALIECAAEIAGAAPSLPFYFYDIPVLTGVSFSMPEFLERAPERIPNLAGIKFTNPDLMAYQRCLQVEGGRFDIPWGIDEALLAALACGAVGGVGSSYNFAAPIYHRLLDAFERGDMATARLEQFRSVQLIELLAGSGYMAAAKAVMGFLGVEVGQPRLPNVVMSDNQIKHLRQALETLGFFDWIKI
ncbi:dihydrodipicolinate synthase family protein [Pirellulaceae bacterium SH449]